MQSNENFYISLSPRPLLAAHRDTVTVLHDVYDPVSVPIYAKSQMKRLMFLTYGFCWCSTYNYTETVSKISKGNRFEAHYLLVENHFRKFFKVAQITKYKNISSTSLIFILLYAFQRTEHSNIISLALYIFLAFWISLLYRLYCTALNTNLPCPHPYLFYANCHHFHDSNYLPISNSLAYINGVLLYSPSLLAAGAHHAHFSASFFTVGNKKVSFYFQNETGFYQLISALPLKRKAVVGVRHTS